MANQKILKSETRTFALVTSILIAIALLTLVIIGLITGNFLNISVVGSSIIVFITALFMGSMQIRVFSNYKNQKKFLCADGIFYICLTILVVISAISYVLVPDSQVDLRYFIFVFGIVFVIWKIIMSIIGFKNKYYNAFAELIIAIFWLLSAVGVLLTTLENVSQTGLYLMCASNYILGVATIFYILFSYVFKEPDFLITEQVLEIVKKDEEEKQARINRLNGAFLAGNNIKPETNNTNNLEDKLQKLQNLKDKNLISSEEFEKRKKEILDSEL